MQKRLWIGLLSLITAPVAFCQVSGALSGSVVDASGAGVPNAQVKVLLPEGKSPVISGKTTNEGNYSFIGVRPGTYDVSVEATGFITAVRHEIRVEPIRETSLPPIKLDIAAVSQSVDVTADVQSVETATTDVATTVSA